MGFLFRASASNSGAARKLIRRAIQAACSSSAGVESTHTARKTKTGVESLLPLAFAASAGVVAFGFAPRASLCDSGDKNSEKWNGGGEMLLRASHRAVSKELFEELRAVCGDNMTVDYEERHFHGKPQHSFHKAVNVPDVVVYPRSHEDVVKIIALCNKYKAPIVPYGGATSIEGHTLAPHGGVCMNMSYMNKIKALHVEDMDVVVEPGIGWIELNEYLKPYGLFFPLDPGPGASIGGMCATRCSGSLAVRYGTMRDNVINIQAVLADGEVIKTGSRARKSAAGYEKLTRYDLARLLIGSEGTLGVITEVTLRLQKLPQYSVVSRVELLDEVQIKAINYASGKDLPEVPTLMFEFIGTEAYSREQTLIVQNIVGEHNGTDFIFVEDPEAKEELWRIRKEALWAALAMEPHAEAMITDVCVPLSRLAECISISKKELDASQLVCTVIAHAGDGNFHTVILFDPSKEDQREEAERLNHLMVHTALLMEGTCTGEHGVGTGKMKYLEEELGHGALKTMKRIKTALDPNDIMNPGKLIPPHVCL
ncbi:FAD-linked oxidases family protein isoform X3 [Wolffia australiana]